MSAGQLVASSWHVSWSASSRRRWGTRPASPSQWPPAPAPRAPRRRTQSGLKRRYVFSSANYRCEKDKKSANNRCLFRLIIGVGKIEWVVVSVAPIRVCLPAVRRQLASSWWRWCGGNKGKSAEAEAHRWLPCKICRAGDALRNAYNGLCKIKAEMHSCIVECTGRWVYLPMRWGATKALILWVEKWHVFFFPWDE